MVRLPTKLVEVVEALRPEVRRRRNEYARVDALLAEQSVSDDAFRCDRCERVQSRFAVGGLVESDDRTEVWCLECIEDREKDARRADRTPGFGSGRF
jgi:hypothetical protein